MVTAPQSDVRGVFTRQRKRAVLAAVLHLLERGASSEQDLAKVAACMSGEELEQAAEERALVGKCGNPLCGEPIKWRPPGKVFNFKERQVDMLPSDHYCGTVCERFVKQYASRLGDPMARLNPAIRERLAASHPPLRSNSARVAAQGGGVETMLSVIKERTPTGAASAAADSTKHGSTSPQHRGALTVEGYTPRAQLHVPTTCMGDAAIDPAQTTGASTAHVQAQPNAAGSVVALPVSTAAAVTGPTVAAAIKGSSDPPPVTSLYAQAARDEVRTPSELASTPTVLFGTSHASNAPEKSSKAGLRPSLKRISSVGQRSAASAISVDSERRVKFAPEKVTQQTDKVLEQLGQLQVQQIDGEGPLLTFSIASSSDTAMTASSDATSADIMQPIGELAKVEGTAEDLGKDGQELAATTFMSRDMQMWFPPALGGVGVSGVSSSSSRQGSNSKHAKPDIAPASAAAVLCQSTSAVEPAVATPPAAPASIPGVQAPVCAVIDSSSMGVKEQHKVGSSGSLRRFMPTVTPRRKTILIAQPSPAAQHAHLGAPTSLSHAAASMDSILVRPALGSSSHITVCDNIALNSEQSGVHPRTSEPPPFRAGPEATSYAGGPRHVVTLRSNSKSAQQVAAEALAATTAAAYLGLDPDDAENELDSDDEQAGMLQACEQDPYCSDDEGGVHATSMSQAFQEEEEEMVRAAGSELETVGAEGQNGDREVQVKSRGKARSVPHLSTTAKPATAAAATAATVAGQATAGTAWLQQRRQQQEQRQQMSTIAGTCSTSSGVPGSKPSAMATAALLPRLGPLSAPHLQPLHASSGNTVEPLQQETHTAASRSAAPWPALRDDLDSDSDVNGADDGDDDEGWSDDDVASGRDSGDGQEVILQTSAPFFGRCPRGFRPELTYLSDFNLLQLHLSSWVTARTTAFITGNGSSQECSMAGAREGNCDAVDAAWAAAAAAAASSVEHTSKGWTRLNLRGDDDDEQAASGTDTSAGARPLQPIAAQTQMRIALAERLGGELPLILLAVAQSGVESEAQRKLSALLATFSFRQAVPSLRPHQWQTLTIIMLAALAPSHLPRLIPSFDMSDEAVRRAVQPFLIASSLDDTLFNALVQWMSRKDVI